MKTQVCIQRPKGKTFELLTRIVVDWVPLDKNAEGVGGCKIELPVALGVEPGNLIINYGGVYRVESVETRGNVSHVTALKDNSFNRVSNA